MTTYMIVRILTTIALTGLLFEIGLRINPREVLDSIRNRNLIIRILLLNFIFIPILALGLMHVFTLGMETSVAILLLAASPFAPVVPIFTKMAKGDLPLAAILTSLFPFISAIATPLVCLVAIRFVPGAGALQFHFALILLVLILTITLPLLTGIFVHHFFPGFTALIHKPVEVLADAAGALSLGFVVWNEWHAIINTGWTQFLAVIILCEISVIAGYWSGPKNHRSRIVTAFGAGNRNIALAMLVALDSFPDSPILSHVVGSGLILILLGLCHTAWWRFSPAFKKA
ncbi:MAG: bile acid:sodium symporter [Verrucomicrobiota bacterium]|nr:bile acid:sodium symporter [Verrucomicrobiota bacterium]